MRWITTRFDIDLSSPKVMGIVNVTPDSFSDGGHHASVASALAYCESLLRQGADILDIGGESSRPGAPQLSVDQEWMRVEGVLKGAVSLGCPVSVDTCKPEIMHRALDLGVDIVNDIKALGAPGSMQVVAAHAACGVCLMHMRGTPLDMQARTDYGDVVVEVGDFLADRARALIEQGIGRDRITLDPGIGFGKTPEQNVTLLKEQGALLALGFPLLVGWSRKSTLGVITGKPVEDRLGASLAAALASVQLGASIVRVHDVGPTVDALKVWLAAGLLQKSIGPGG